MFSTGFFFASVFADFNGHFSSRLRLSDRFSRGFYFDRLPFFLYTQVDGVAASRGLKLPEWLDQAPIEVRAFICPGVFIYC